MRESAPGDGVVGQVVGELVELVEDDVDRVLGQGRAGVVDLAHVALGARRADDVARLGDPALQPREALVAHPRGQDRHAAAAHDARDRHAAAAVVAGGRPHRALARRVEAAGDQARRKAAVGRQHLVRVDHREAVAERDDDRRRHAGQRLGEHHVRGHRRPGRCARRRCTSARGRGCSASAASGSTPASLRAPRGADALGLGQLGEGRQRDAPGAEVLEGAVVGRTVGDRRVVAVHGSAVQSWAMRVHSRWASAVACARSASRSMLLAVSAAAATGGARRNARPAARDRPAAAAPRRRGRRRASRLPPATRCVRPRGPTGSRRCRARRARWRAALRHSRRGCRGSSAGSAPASSRARRRGAPAVH